MDELQSLKTIIPEIPPTLLEKIKTKEVQKTEKRPEGWEKEYFGVAVGRRNDALTKLAGRYAGKGLSREETLLSLTAANSTYNPPLPESEVINILNSILKTHQRNKKAKSKSFQGQTSPLPGEVESVSLLNFNLTDSGNAECFDARNKDNFVFVEEENEWRRVEDGKWIKADREALIEMRNTMREKGRQAMEFIEDPEKIKPIVKHSLGSESNLKLNSALNIAKSMMYVQRKIFDANPLVFGCGNGAIDLQTGELFQPTKDDWICKSSLVEYHPLARLERFLQVLEECSCHDADWVDFFQKAVGYTMTGLNTEQVLFFLFGGGANGKSLLLNILGDLFGPYGITSPASMFKENLVEGISTDVAGLEGKRFIRCSEIKENARFNEERLKALTGGDELSARHLYHEAKNFKVTGKIWLAANHKPAIRDTTDSIWRRVRLIPFDRQFKPEEQDQTLYEKLQAELPGILAWAVQGCLKWQRDGLQAIKRIAEATKQYREESDAIGRFLEERTTKCDKLAEKAGDLYKGYSEWCKDNGEWPVNSTNFGRAMVEKGYKKNKDSHVRYLGILLKRGNDDTSV